MDMNYATNGMANSTEMMNSRFENMKHQYTPGYKAEVVQFNDLVNSAMKGGAKAKKTTIAFDQGQIFKTQTATNLAINGQGFFVVSDGFQNHYTRDGRFEWKEGQLKDALGKTVMGFPLDAQGNISGDSSKIELTMDPNTKLYGGKYTGFKFDETGKLYGESTITDPVTGNQVTTETPLYQVSVASFANASGLSRTGDTSFGETDDSGKAVIGVAGQGALGSIEPGALELSNVDYLQETNAVIMTKRNFEANMAAFRTMDKITQSALGLVR